MAGIWRMLAINGLLLVLYVLLGHITFTTSVQYGNVTSVLFAPEGVALAFSILFGPTVAPGIVLGQGLLSHLAGPSFSGGLAIGLINAAEALLGGYLFRRWGMSRSLSRPRDVALLALMVLLILQPISATGGMLVLLASGVFPIELSHILPGGWSLQEVQSSLTALSMMAPAWLYWWMGNSLGQLLVTPLLLVWLGSVKRKARSMHGFEWALLSGGMVAVVLVASSGVSSSPLLLLALSYGLLGWVGLRCGIRMITVVNLVLTILIVGLTLFGRGFMSSLPMADSMFYVSFFVAIGALFSLLLFSLFEERRDLIQRLTTLASTDPLTGVSNRRSFMEQAEREAAVARRHGTPLCLAVVDVDHFKTVNDTYGHQTGDEVLKMLAECCLGVMRSGDLVGRIGGEEFALLLPRTGAVEAREAVERLLDMVRHQSVSAPDGTPVRITFSAGIAQGDRHASVESILREADQILYRAKQAGRNRVLVSVPDAANSDPVEAVQRRG